jgi:endonuclease/exonuclease/phosphatase family metal-dependent hydrolase
MVPMDTLRGEEAQRKGETDGDDRRGSPRPPGRILLLFPTLLLVTLVWWAVGRITAESRRLSVHEIPETEWAVMREAHPWDEPGVFGLPEDTAGEYLTILAWNIAHGRGDVPEGWLSNWRGGTGEDRISRLIHIADVIREVDADVVLLNEVDFEAQWSGHLNQGEILARVTGYPSWIEQRNYDLWLPFLRWSFGNALLSRMPVPEAGWVDLPPHSAVEAIVAGAKSASLVRLETELGPLGIVPIHLEVRSRHTRRPAAEVFDSLRNHLPYPLILAGDFNSAPSGWPGAEGRTLLDSVLALGWTSPRAQGPPLPREFTFPTPALQDARDWILVEPPLRVVGSRVLHEVGRLSDHAPVLAVIALSPTSPQLPPEGDFRSAETAKPRRN